MSEREVRRVEILNEVQFGIATVGATNSMSSIALYLSPGGTLEKQRLPRSKTQNLYVKRLK